MKWTGEAPGLIDWSRSLVLEAVTVSPSLTHPYLGQSGFTGVRPQGGNLLFHPNVDTLVYVIMQVE